MGQDDLQKHPLARLAFKVGSVAAAAAALLSEGRASGSESDVLKGILERNQPVSTIAQDAGLSDLLSPPPLILTPPQSDTLLLAGGHRSHSSHSSHRSHSSHTSGSSHASHYSSSTRIGLGGFSSTSAPASTPASSPRASSSEVSGSSVFSKAAKRAAAPKGGFITLDEVPDQAPPPAESPGIGSPIPNTPESSSTTPAPPPAAATVPDDPAKRFQIITIGVVDARPRAFVKDLKTKLSKMLYLGDSIGGFKATQISTKEQSVTLQPANGPAIVVEFRSSLK